MQQAVVTRSLLSKATPIAGASAMKKRTTLCDLVCVSRYSRPRIRFGSKSSGTSSSNQRTRVAKKRGNPNWGKPEVNIIHSYRKPKSGALR